MFQKIATFNHNIALKIAKYFSLIHEEEDEQDPTLKYGYLYISFNLNNVNENRRGDTSVTHIELSQRRIFLYVM